LTVAALLVAAGKSVRFTSPTPKQLWPLKGKPLIQYSIEFFVALGCIDVIVIAVSESIKADVERIAAGCCGSTRVDIIRGGDRRQDSVMNGLRVISPDTDVVSIHDAARPFPPVNATRASIRMAQESGAAIVAVPARDTVKACLNDIITDTLDRAIIWLAQTPQTFRYELILRGYEKVVREKREITDDAQAVEVLGEKVRVVEGHSHNIKITFPEDIETAEAILSHRG